MRQRAAGSVGACDPPQSEHFVRQGEHETSVRDEAVRLMLERIRVAAPEPDEVERVEPKLRAALAELAVDPER